MRVQLVKPGTGRIKEAKIDFSWTVFFFNFFPAIFRGDWKWALIMLLASSATFGISNLIFMFIYNKLYINELLDNGYVPLDAKDAAILHQKGFIAMSA